MRRTFAVIALLLLPCVLLSGCVADIRSERDEIRLYHWAGEYENGNKVSLSFKDHNAILTIDYPDGQLTIRGLCSLTDNQLLIFDEESEMNRIFSYTLGGDSLLLSYDGGELTLKKVVG